MLNAIERGREPAVDFLNGEVVSRGENHGIPTPINAGIAALIRRIAAGKARSSHDTLRKFYDETRISVLGTTTPPPPETAPETAPETPEGEAPPA